MAKKKSSAMEWVVVIGSALVIALLIRSYLFAPYQVHGTSMFPTLNGDELLIVNKWIYKVSAPEYGDIVVFHTPEERDFIKRVIGLPGDRISIKNGKVYRNGQLLREPYINGAMRDEPPEERNVPEGTLFVLGDNRNNSKDSREIGPVSMENIVGRAEVVVWPLHSISLISLKN
ncbi:signal peptidase I [Paenactinomyces guangxiensis]|uniref:Signal peptidase I n=1 Tax=Paenactinomyces guangxiensis TaxID=1490290 RepID=A0A7W1WTK3_9BACL|nr:signal peptidase I [Paenactinomyces guangxiensis]MBA4495833.1 signal peptidase I [Paenactinomyces guangxiensis]MBH8592923.1 signal peptidase I [Paenactinomyces guangxiensis]